MDNSVFKNTGAIAVFAAFLAIPDVATAAEPDARPEPPLEALPAPSAVALVAPEAVQVPKASAPIEPPAPAGENELQAAMARWEVQHSAHVSRGLTIAGIAYGVSAGVGATMFGLSSLGSAGSGARSSRKAAAVSNFNTGWAAPMFIPVAGPIYVGAKIIVEYTKEMARAKGEFAGLAVIFAPFAYALGLVSIVDGVVQGVGFGMAAGLDESARPTATTNQASLAKVPARAKPKQATAGFQKLWVLPSASERQVGLQMGGAFF
jgi:hypothetical protein